jgi:hypothetical protein
MSEVKTVPSMLIMLGFTANTAQYTTRSARMVYLQEIAFLDDSDVENLVNHVTRPGGTTTTVI